MSDKEQNTHCCHSQPVQPAHVTSSAGDLAGKYICPMCPGVVSDVPAPCPVCGMALEPLTPVAAEGDNAELRDMERRFRLCALLTLPLVIALNMSDEADQMGIEIRHEELAELFGVPLEVLPQVVASSGVVAETDPQLFGSSVPVAGIAGDQQAALFGQACYLPGQSKCTYGTGAFILENIGDRPIPSKHGLLTTVAWQLDDKTSYALEGSAFIAGAAVQWLRDGMGLIESSGGIEELARQVQGSDGVVFIPALTGLGAPHWRSEARGQITGLTRGTTAAHLARATLEGIALQIHDLVMAMTDDRGIPGSILKVDGGAAENNLLMQMQADLINRPVSRPETIETTALGAAMLAGLAIGFWADTKELAKGWNEEKCFAPHAGDDWRETLLEQWREAIGRIRG